MLPSLLWPDSVGFRAEVPVAARAGEPVPIVLPPHEHIRRPLIIPLRGRPFAVEVTVTREDGRVVYRRLGSTVATSGDS